MLRLSFVTFAPVQFGCTNIWFYWWPVKIFKKTATYWCNTCKC